MNLNRQEEKRVRNRMGQITDEIDEELDYQNYAASSDLDYEMSKARLAALNTEYRKLEKLVE